MFRNEAIDRTHLAEFHQIEGGPFVLPAARFRVALASRRCVSLRFALATLDARVLSDLGLA